VEPPGELNAAHGVGRRRNTKQGTIGRQRGRRSAAGGRRGKRALRRIKRIVPTAVRHMIEDVRPIELDHHIGLVRQAERTLQRRIEGELRGTLDGVTSGVAKEASLRRGEGGSIKMRGPVDRIERLRSAVRTKVAGKACTGRGRKIDGILRQSAADRKRSKHSPSTHDRASRSSAIHRQALHQTCTGSWH